MKNSILATFNPVMSEAIKTKDLFHNMRETGCQLRWNYPVVKFDRAEIRTCCQVATNEKVTPEDLERKGSEVFLNSDYLLERRIEMLKGIKHPDCSACWKLEDVGMPSKRTLSYNLGGYLKNQVQKLSFLPSIPETHLKEIAHATHPALLEIQLDNVCDMSCIYCSADYSTTWAKKLGKSFVPPSASHLEKFQDEFWSWYEGAYHDLNGVAIIGGEPLASPIFIPTLEKLHEIHAKINRALKRQFLTITSNFNSQPSSFMRFLNVLETLAPYFDFTIIASIEACGKRAEFIRDGLIWDRFNENVESFLKFTKRLKEKETTNRIDFCVQPAQNALSLIDLKNFLLWAESLEEKFNVPVNLVQNIVTYPDYLAIHNVLSKDFSRHCDEALEILHQHDSSRLDYVQVFSWPNYATFITSIRETLMSRSPEKIQQERLLRWIDSLPQEKKDLFAGEFGEIRQSLP